MAGMDVCAVESRIEPRDNAFTSRLLEAGWPGLELDEMWARRSISCVVMC